MTTSGMTKRRMTVEVLRLTQSLCQLRKVTFTSQWKLISKERFQDYVQVEDGSQLSPTPSIRMVRSYTRKICMKSNGLSHIKLLRQTTRPAMNSPWRSTTNGTLGIRRTIPSRSTLLRSSKSGISMERLT